MRVLSIILPILSVLAPAVLAEGDGVSTSCVSTMTSTRTVMKVVTETHTGTGPSTTPSVSLVSQAPTGNSTASRVPSATSPSASKPPVNTDVPGAAGQMAIPQIAVGVIAAGAGLLFL